MQRHMIRQLTPPVATETLPVRPSTSERDENTQSPSRSQFKPGEVTTGTDAAVDSRTPLLIRVISRVYAQYWIPNLKSNKMTLERSLHSLKASHQTCQLPRSLRSLEIVQSIADLRSAESELRCREDITVTWLGDSVVLHEVT